MNPVSAAPPTLHLSADGEVQLAGRWTFAGLRDHAELSKYLVPYYERDASEVSPVERSVMLMAAFELVSHPQTPCPVIINEAIEIAKTFGGTDGHKFVNGVLDKLAADVRQEEVQAIRSRRQAD